MPNYVWWIIAAVLFVAYIIYSKTRKPSGLSYAVSQTLEDKDISHVLKEISESDSATVQATKFNTAIKPIWDAYERETASSLVKEMLIRCGDEPIAQHWLMTVTQVEPEIARKQFTEEFIKEHYKPEIAAKCAGGCCGGGGGSCKSCKGGSCKK